MPIRRRLWSRLLIRYLREPKIAVRTGPHPPAGFGGDNQLIPVGPQPILEHFSKYGFCGARWRTVIIGQIEMGDSHIEGAGEIMFLAVFIIVNLSEINAKVPEENGRQHESAFAGPAVGGWIRIVFRRGMYMTGALG